MRLILALHYEARFLKNPGSMARATTGFDHILARYGQCAMNQAEPMVCPRFLFQFVC